MGLTAFAVPVHHWGPAGKRWPSAAATLAARGETLYSTLSGSVCSPDRSELLRSGGEGWSDGTGGRCDGEEAKLLSLDSALELVLRLPGAEPAPRPSPSARGSGKGRQQKSVEGQQSGQGLWSPPVPCHVGSGAGTCWLGSPPERRAGEGPRSLPCVPRELGSVLREEHPCTHQPSAATSHRPSAAWRQVPFCPVAGGWADQTPAGRARSCLSWRDPLSGVFNRQPSRHPQLRLAVMMGSCWTPNPPLGRLLPAPDTGGAPQHPEPTGNPHCRERLWGWRRINRRQPALPRRLLPLSPVSRWTRVRNEAQPTTERAGAT